jgi:NAD-specific glutamate dehydrogenase
LLAAMTDEVAEMVLRDNALQSVAVSLEALAGAAALPGQATLMARLYEKDGLTLRAIADLMQTTYQNVHGILTRRRVRMRKRGGNTGSHSRHRS